MTFWFFPTYEYEGTAHTYSKSKPTFCKSKSKNNPSIKNLLHNDKLQLTDYFNLQLIFFLKKVHESNFPLK